MPLVWENGPKFERYAMYYYCRIGLKRLLVVKTLHGSVTCYHCWARDDDSPPFTPDGLQFWFRGLTLASAFETADRLWRCMWGEEQKIRSMGNLITWYCIAPNNYVSYPSAEITLRIANVEASNYERPVWKLYCFQERRVKQTFYGSLEEALQLGDTWLKELSPVKYLGQRLGKGNG